MSSIDFTWDERKNSINKRKHKVSFEEARSAFFDENAIVYDDPDHSSDNEERFILLGSSSLMRTLVVCHCYRESDTEIRIFSARKANRKEQKDYWEA